MTWQERITTGDEMQMRFSVTNKSKSIVDRVYTQQKSTEILRRALHSPNYVRLVRVCFEPLKIYALIVTPRKLEILGETLARDIWV